MMMVPLEHDDDGGGGEDNDVDNDDEDGSDDDMAMIVARSSGMNKFCGIHQRRLQMLHNVSI